MPAEDRFTFTAQACAFPVDHEVFVYTEGVLLTTSDRAEAFFRLEPGQHYRVTIHKVAAPPRPPRKRTR